MIGSTYFAHNFIPALNAPIEAWENTLEANHDDYVVVDNEEGDFGIISYFGPDASGNIVRMMVEYVHGGDNENTYYTKEGIEHIRNVLLGNLLATAFDTALLGELDPVEGENGLRIGAIKAIKDADAKAREDAANAPTPS
jgi:hypothetical protein